MTVSRTAGTVAFADALDVALRIATLSPSSHNCQPWALAHLRGGAARGTAARLLGEPRPGELHYLALALDRDRQLSALPAHHTEMVLSCGAYWHPLLDALAAGGWPVAAHRAGTPAPGHAFGAGWPGTWSPLAVAGLRRGEMRPAALAELRAAAAARRTNRGPYLSEPVDAALLQGLAAGRGRSRPPALAVVHVTDPDRREAFAAIVARHAGRDYSCAAAWRETYASLRWSRADAAARGDGFVLADERGRLAGVRRWRHRAVLWPPSMRVLARSGYARVLARRLADAVRSAPVLVAMGLPELSTCSDRELLSAGGRLADYWLRATAAGLALHPISVLTQHEDLRELVRECFGLPGRPVFVARLGRPAVDAPPSARRPVTYLTL